MKLIDSLNYKPTELTFGTSGLRGLVADMTNLECYINVAGFLEFLKAEDGLKEGDTVYIAGDLRDSTPGIMSVVAQAIVDNGCRVVNCGYIPTPAVAYYSISQNAPSIMVTGSHIPSDRNGIKFYKRLGEVLKSDEAGIQQQVSKIRQVLYEQEVSSSSFEVDGETRSLAKLTAVVSQAERFYIKRYCEVFDPTSLASKTVVVYQQSAVGRDIIVQILESLGACVIPIERSDKFVPVDSENVDDELKKLFLGLSRKYPEAFAIVSTDGDSDRPLVIDETGEFHRGDELGCVVARYLRAGFAAVPISSNDAVDSFCKTNGIELVHTKIGSPYVIAAMERASDDRQPIVSWEVNGGFLMGSEAVLGNGKTLSSLPTRDAVLPIICVLLAAAQGNQLLSEMFGDLPQRFTGGGLVEGIKLGQIAKFHESLSKPAEYLKELIEKVFPSKNYSQIVSIDLLDGLRIRFENDDVIHLRPSGNAPQLRIYTNANSQTRADEIVTTAVAPGGLLEQFMQLF